MDTSREDALRAVYPGWHKLVNEFYNALDDWNCKHSEEKVIVYYVKQKWGDLRISFSPNVKELNDVYNEIRKNSNTICEICGYPGKHVDMNFNGSYWMYVLCKKHSIIHPINYFETANY